MNYQDDRTLSGAFGLTKVTAQMKLVSQDARIRLFKILGPGPLPLTNG